MLTLRNIKRTNNIIEADFYPENENVYGHVVVDLDTEDIISYTQAKGYEHSTCPTHALYELLRMKDLKEFPEKRVVLWY